MAWADMLVEMLSRSFLGEAEADARSGGARTPVKGIVKKQPEQEDKVHLKVLSTLRSDSASGGWVDATQKGKKRSREEAREEDMELEGDVCFTSTPIGSPLAGVKAGYGSDDGYEGDVSMPNIGMGGLLYPVSSPLIGIRSRWTFIRELNEQASQSSPTPFSANGGGSNKQLVSFSEARTGNGNPKGFDNEDDADSHRRGRKRQRRGLQVPRGPRADMDRISKCVLLSCASAIQAELGANAILCRARTANCIVTLYRNYTCGELIIQARHPAH